MNNDAVNIGGILIPFHSPVFLSIVGVHVLAGIACVISGITAMLSRKGPGRHPAFGRIYFRSYIIVFITTIILSLARWREDYYLLIIGVIAFAFALMGQFSFNARGKGWPALHITGMGMSFILLLTAFYLDNGKNLPVWKDLPSFMYWLLPNGIGIPLIIYALFKYRNLKGKGKDLG